MTSRCVLIRKPGSHERLELHSRTPPSAGPSEVRVRARAAGVNYADCIVRMGLYSSALEYVGWPITPRFEVAGEIDQVGPGSTRRVGERVIAVTRFGGYSQHVVVPEHRVFALPESLSFEEGASLPTVFLTAWYALFELAHLRPDASMLVHSAAGGVGSALVQLGKLARLRVAGVVGHSTKVSIAREMGADLVIDGSTERVWASAGRFAPSGFDAIFDANGVSSLRQSHKHLAKPGKLVVYGFASMLPRTGQRLSYLRLAIAWLRTPRFDPLLLTRDCTSVMAFNLSYLFDRRELLEEGMNFILEHLSRGEIRLPPIECFALEDVADAHRALESGKTVGKLVLTMKGS